MTETLSSYIRLTDDMDKHFKKEYTNVFKSMDDYNAIKREIQEKCDVQEAYDFEKGRVDAHTAYARVLNMFGEEKVKNLKR